MGILLKGESIAMGVVRGWTYSNGALELYGYRSQSKKIVLSKHNSKLSPCEPSKLGGSKFN